MIKGLAADPKERQVPLQPGQKYIIGKNWITRFLNRHPILVTKVASCIGCQRTYAGNPCILQDHFRKLGKVITERKLKPKVITNVDEKGFVMGISPRTKVITRQGKKNPRVTHSGKRKFITRLEAVSADGFIFPPYLIGKGAKHIFDWYKNVKEEDKMAHWAVSPKGSTDKTIGYDWLPEVYDPISGQCCPNETRLLILDGHVSHINYKFLKYCEQNDIIVLCLAAHSTHLLQPLDVVLSRHCRMPRRKQQRITSILSLLVSTGTFSFPSTSKHERSLHFTKHTSSICCYGNSAIQSTHRTCKC